MTTRARMGMLSTISRKKRSTLQLRVWLHLAIGGVAAAGLHSTCRLAGPSAATSILHSSYSVVWFVYFHRTEVSVVTSKRCAMLGTRKIVRGSSRGGECGVWRRFGGGCRNRWAERCGKDDDDGDARWFAKADVGGISNSGCPGGTERAAPDSGGGAASTGWPSSADQSVRSHCRCVLTLPSSGSSRAVACGCGADRKT